MHIYQDFKYKLLLTPNILLDFWTHIDIYCYSTFENFVNIFGSFILVSSVKWSDPGHFLEAQDKFIFSFPCTLFYTYF